VHFVFPGLWSDSIDRKALDLASDIVDRELQQVALNGGSIHCATQQWPAPTKVSAKRAQGRYYAEDGALHDGYSGNLGLYSKSESYMCLSP
jgi:hypothetical protein